MKNLKTYAGMLTLVAGVSFTPITVFAEEETEEVVYEVTEDNVGDVVFEDIPESEVETEKETEGEKIEVETEGETEGEKIEVETEVETEEYIFDPNNTEIDPEDQKYDTGRIEIPDTVPTEWERKDIDNNPENPQNPEEPPKPEQPENPQQQKEPEPIPKTGNIKETFVALGAALGLVSVIRIANSFEQNIDSVFGVSKVVKSRRKFRFRKPKRRSR